MSVRINLACSDVKKRGFSLYLIVACLVASLVISLWHFILYKNIEEAKKQYIALGQEQELLIKKTKKDNGSNMFQKKSSQSDKIIKSQIFFVKIFRLLNGSIGGVKLNSLTIDDYKAQLTGQAKVMASIFMFVKKLSDSAGAGIKIKKIIRQNNIYEFSIVLFEPKKNSCSF